MAQKKAKIWLSAAACVLAASARAQTPVPSDIAAHCTRGTNPFQDVKDGLNLVMSDLQGAAAAKGASDQKHTKRQARRVQKSWARVVAESLKAHRALPADLGAALQTATDLMLKDPAARAAPSAEDLQALVKKVDDLSMIMTCVE